MDRTLRLHQAIALAVHMTKQKSGGREQQIHFYLTSLTTAYLAVPYLTCAAGLDRCRLDCRCSSSCRKGSSPFSICPSFLSCLLVFSTSRVGRRSGPRLTVPCLLCTIVCQVARDLVFYQEVEAGWQGASPIPRHVGPSDAPEMPLAGCLRQLGFVPSSSIG